MNWFVYHRHMIGLLCSVALLLPGCAKYRASSLRNLSSFPSSTSQGQEEISFKYRIFDVKDCIKYLGRNVIKKGYQPVQLTIYNNTPIAWSLLSCSIECIPGEEVAESVHLSSINRAVGYGLAGFFISWPFGIAAAVDSTKAKKANRKLDRDFARKALRCQHIAPHSSTNGLIFINPDECFEHNFSFTMTDTKTDQRVTLSCSNPAVTIKPVS